jgi:hypothetical protein
MPTFAQLRERYPNATLGFLAANASDGLPAALAPRKPDVTPAKVKGAAPGKSKGKRAGRVPRTRNANTWTEAQYWQAIRSCLRRMSRFWKPAVAALHAARFPCKGPKGQKWAYLCHDCKKPFPRKQVQIDHVVPCGTLTDFEHVGEFIRRLTPESAGAYAIRCLTCHQEKTNAERSTGAGRECRKPAVPSIPAAP